MNLPWKKFKTEHQWEYEPYAFEVGRKYVIEINTANIELEEVNQLKNWFYDNGLNVKLVLAKGNSELRALQPIEVKRMTEVIK